MTESFLKLINILMSLMLNNSTAQNHMRQQNQHHPCCGKLPKTDNPISSIYGKRKKEMKCKPKNSRDFRNRSTNHNVGTGTGSQFKQSWEKATVTSTRQLET